MKFRAIKQPERRLAARCLYGESMKRNRFVKTSGHAADRARHDVALNPAVAIYQGPRDYAIDGEWCRPKPPNLPMGHHEADVRRHAHDDLARSEERVPDLVHEAPPKPPRDRARGAEVQLQDAQTCRDEQDPEGHCQEVGLIPERLPGHWVTFREVQGPIGIEHSGGRNDTFEDAGDGLAMEP
eukprot:CAMPEP_0115538708 /NCGR_PEP_ID=MMETSP0271-20121206/89020_1 /TAXON_ID=71861 /ORGANISM="Scrippsiella trochoidea, Strain CCMP3099" /LENGTH=182 /DNA_ID=CAMNT_0002971617 /DNA_START=341 /DNA_END=889 /DNA_ORIENTATION=+